MATVSQMKNESWFVNWSVGLSNNAQTKFKCDNKMAFKLAVSYAQSKVTLILSEEPTFAVAPGASIKIPFVTAAYNGQTQDMVRSSSLQWDSVSWSYAPNSHRHIVPASTMLHPLNASNAQQQPFLPVIMQPICVGLTNPHSEKFVTFQLIIDFEGKNQTTQTQKTCISDGEQQVLTHLSNLLDTQKMVDICFVVKNEKIGAHLAFVVSASPVMAAMLENDWKERRTNSVEINDIEPSVFKEMLRYLYTGTAPNLHEAEMTEPLFFAADKYQIEHLKKDCEQGLIKKINLQNVVHYLVIAHLHTAPNLFEASLKFLEGNKRGVWTRPEWQQLVDSYPQLFYVACKRMIDGKVWT